MRPTMTLDEYARYQNDPNRPLGLWGPIGGGVCFVKPTRAEMEFYGSLRFDAVPSSRRPMGARSGARLTRRPVTEAEARQRFAAHVAAAARDQRRDDDAWGRQRLTSYELDVVEDRVRERLRRQR